MLQQQGYATDPEYAQKLIQIANRFRWKIPQNTLT
jgi:flagellum-specific peptidoglycan hydrolase FlgJ